LWPMQQDYRESGKMDSYQGIEKFKEFLEEYYLDHLLDNFRTGKNFLVIDFRKLLEFDPSLAEKTLDDPDEQLKNASSAVRQFEIPGNMKRFNVRLDNLPDCQKLALGDIRSNQLEKLFIFEGIVRQKSDVLPQALNAKFECPACGNMISIIQEEKKFREPTGCQCGRKGKFTLISKELIDAQSLTLEESTDDLEGGAQAKRRRAILKEDLVSPMADRKTNPGTKIQVIGTVKEVPIRLKSGGKSITSDLIIEANYVKSVEDSYAEIEVSDDELREIKKLSKDKYVYKKLIDSIAPAPKVTEKSRRPSCYSCLAVSRSSARTEPRCEATSIYC